MKFNPDEDQRKRIEKIRLLILDVDGVLTDGRIIYDSDGRDLKCFDVQDGVGLRLLRVAGIKTVLISAKSSKTIQRRAQDLKISEFYEGAEPKVKVLEEILGKHEVGREEICFVGDDLVDLGIMKKVGFPVAVMNACDEIKEAARYVTRKTGGRGAVREVAELILRTQGRWEETVAKEFGP